MPASIRPVLSPRSVAVLGASRSLGSVGGELLANLMRCHFNGPVYPVNPSASYVQSVRAYHSVLDIPDEVDLAVLALPASHAAEALEQCGRKGVRAVVVVSAGFKEIGGEGVEREAELLGIARRYGMRLVGPNCLGVINTRPDVSLNATFAHAFPDPGPVAFLSQSGALGVAVLDRAAQLGIGVSSFVSVGNRSDVSGNDVLEHWAEDDDTRVVLMYLESFGNPRRFTRLARRIAREKPIVAVKSGRTLSGSRAAASHTGALAGTDTAVEALFEQAGVLRVTTIEELFDTGMLLATQPVPRGRRVAILTNAGGPGILAADACEHYSLELPTLTPQTLEALAGFLPPEASLGNPVDMIASADAESYRRAVSVLLADDNVDALLVIFVPPLMTAAPDVARAIAGSAASTNKSVVSCFMGTHGFRTGLHGESEGDVRIPSYAFPESAARALARTAGYGEWLQHADSPIVPVEIGTSRGVEVCEAAAAQSESGGVWLPPGRVTELLSSYGIRTPGSAVANSAAEAAQKAAELGFPVVLKVIADQVAHKSDIGGVILDQRNPEEVEKAYAGIQHRVAELGLGSAFRGVLVQRYLQQGIEAVVGLTLDRTFGPLVMFGLGGIHVELLQDVAFRLHPLTRHDIDSMIDSVQASKLLAGYRGAPAGDVDALRDLLARVNRMVDDIDCLLEMDLNPVKILPPGEGCVVVDARVRCDHIVPGGA